MDLKSIRLNWESFFRFAGNMYSYNFNEQVNLYNLYPTATSVATVRQWHVMSRRINSGEKGTRISGNVYVYNIDQTHGAEVKKWSYAPAYNPYYYNILRQTKLTDNVISENKDLSVNIYDFVYAAMGRNKSISGKVENELKEVIAAAVAYTTLSRLDMLGQSSVKYDFSLLNTLDDNSVEYVGSIVAVYSNAMLRAAKQTVKTTTAEQLEYLREKEESSTIPELELSEFEDVKSSDELLDFDPDEFEDVTPAENDVKNYIVANEDSAMSSSDTNDNFAEDTDTQSITQVESLSETSGISSDLQRELLREALLADNSKISKDKIARYYQTFNRRTVIVPYTKNMFHNKRFATNNKNYPCLSGYIGKKNGLLLQYNHSEEEPERILVDWLTVAKEIRSLINENLYITHADEQSENAETAEKNNESFDVRYNLPSKGMYLDSIGTYITESSNEISSGNVVYGTYASYEEASKKLAELRKELEKDDLSEFYSKLTVKERQVERNNRFYYNGILYCVYEVSRTNDTAEIVKDSDIDSSIAYIQRTEKNKPPVEIVTYNSLYKYVNNPARYKIDPRHFRGSIEKHNAINDDISLKPLSKKEKAEYTKLVQSLIDSYDRWHKIYENGNTDPFYEDGTSLNLVRNHILYEKRKIKDDYYDRVTALQDSSLPAIPEQYNWDIPDEVSPFYNALKVGDVIDLSDSEDIIEYADKGIFEVQNINTEPNDAYNDVTLLSLDTDEQVQIKVKMRYIKGKWKRHIGDIVRTENQEIQDNDISNSTEEISELAKSNYTLMTTLFPEFFDLRTHKTEYYSAEAERKTLSIEWNGPNTITMYHGYEQNGKIVYNPKLEFKIENNAAIPTSYEDTVLTEHNITNHMQAADRFVDGWLKVIANNKYKLNSYVGYVPTVTCEFSESRDFEDRTVYSIAEFNQKMKKADAEWVALRQKEIDTYGNDFDKIYNAYEKGEIDEIHQGYAKTKFTVNMPNGDHYCDRQDIGDGFGGLIDYLKLSVYKNIVPELEAAIKQEKDEIIQTGKTFSEQVDDVLAGKANRYNDIKVCDTPQILLNVGCKQLPMFYTQQHLRKVIQPKNLVKHTHGLTEDQIKKLPELLANPVMIYDSLSRQDSLVVVTSEVDTENDPIIISIHPNGSGKYDLERVSSNFITSVYGRENFDKHLELQLQADNILYINKEKSQELFSVLRLQFSQGLNALDSDIIIHQSNNIVNSVSDDIQSKISENVSIGRKEAEQIKLQESEYRLLSRLKQDCDYYLGAGNKNAKHLWADTPEAQITKIKELYDKLQYKPEWLTAEDIARYEKAMLSETIANEVKQDENIDTGEQLSFFGNSEVSSKPEYDIGYGKMGNGITVWNSAKIDKETNDYEIIAHIDTHNRIAVKFYIDVPETVKEQINAYASQQQIDLNKDELMGTSILSFLGANDKDDGYTILLEYKYEDGDVKLYNYVDTTNRSETEALPFEVGDTIEYNDRIYEIESINQPADEIKLLDNNTGWYPMTNNEKLSSVLDYYNSQTSEEELQTKIIADVEDELAENYVIKGDNWGLGGPKEKCQKNLAAIKLMKELEFADRQATAEEQEVLAQYVGWGGIPQVFEEANDSWHSEYTQLKDLLTEKEYESAYSSVLNAHYTSPAVIRSMYKALEQFGFKGGNILEPACGIGNFLGAAPESIRSNSKYTGIELDSITGRIAKQLYPQSNIQICGFENAKLKEGYYDVAIGNVPFGDYSVVDRKYNKQHNLIHDYFFSKSLDMVRPGGVVAFITSKGTLDKQNPKVRKVLNEKANLIGAVRLPSNAFKAAGTEVITDIIFLQKKTLPSTERQEWIDVALDNQHSLPINQYYISNPQMICGNLEPRSTRYGYELTVKAYEDIPIEQAIDNCISNLSARIELIPAKRKITERKEDKQAEWKSTQRLLEADPDMRANTCTIIDDVVYQKKSGILFEVDLRSYNKKSINEFKSFVELGIQTRRTIDSQTESSNMDFEVERIRLGELYDDHIKKYGLIATNKSKIFGLYKQTDENCPLVEALETPVEENDKIKYVKAPMFTHKTISNDYDLTSVKSIADAYGMSMGIKGYVDLNFIAEISNSNVSECINTLNGSYIYLNPVKAKSGNVTSGWEPADEYLSGNVINKLNIAKAYANTDPKYEINVNTLTSVQPERIHAADISCQLGSSWIPEEVIEKFLYEKLDVSVTVEHNVETSNWRINNKNFGNSKYQCYQTYGTGYYNALKIVENALNLRDSKVYKIIYEDGNEKRVIDVKKTEVVTNKQDVLKELFKNWVYTDAHRTKALEDIYNEKFNCERPRKFDGSFLIFPGMNTDIKLKDHQRNAVARILYGSNTLLAHVVGAGKTFEMTAAAMESKRIGTIKKPLFVVPNHLINQWASEFRTLYPAANVLAATTKDFAKDKRKAFCARIATGDYDAVIMGYSTFSMITISPERRKDYYEEQIQECISAISADKDDRLSVKDAASKKKKLETKLKSLEYEKDRDSNIYFEQLGVDALYIDEAHNFKNLGVQTKLSRIAGISTTASNRAEDMYLKIKYISEINNAEKGVVFATGTPLSNSITEMYIMQKYLQPDHLKQCGHSSFDSWIADYGEITTSIELDPTGTSFRSKTRCNQFKNADEMLKQFWRCADVQSREMLDLPVPKLKNDKYTVVITKPSEEQRKFIENCADRAEDVHSRRVTPDVDNMLKITNDGKMCALDYRLIDPNAPDDENSKVNVCISNIYNKWQETSADKLTQVVFLDRSTPGTDFNLYDDIKTKLIKMGVPEKEIAFIHDAKTDVQKKDLFDKVNNGDVRVILGSTEKMGAGTNIQKKLCALHHLDVPWRPADIEQREGRILRQGNECSEVEIFRYATEKTFDAYSWQTIENKQKMISTVMSGKLVGRSIDDIDEQVLNYAEIKSLATGDERIKEHLELSLDVNKLKSQKVNYNAEMIRTNELLTFEYPKQVVAQKARIDLLTDDINYVNDTPYPDNFCVKINGSTFRNRADAGKAVIALKNAVNDDMYLCDYRGFTISLKKDMHTPLLEISRKSKISCTVGISHEGVFNNIDNAIDFDLIQNLKQHKSKLAEVEKNIKNAEEQLKKSFPFEEELKNKTARLQQLTKELSLDDNSDSRGIALDDDGNLTRSSGRR